MGWLWTVCCWGAVLLLPLMPKELKRTSKFIGRHGSNKNLDENIILYGFYDSFLWFVEMFLRYETKKSKEKHLVVKNL